MHFRVLICGVFLLSAGFVSSWWLEMAFPGEESPHHFPAPAVLFLPGDNETEKNSGQDASNSFP